MLGRGIPLILEEKITQLNNLKAFVRGDSQHKVSLSAERSLLILIQFVFSIILKVFYTDTFLISNLTGLFKLSSHALTSSLIEAQISIIDLIFSFSDMSRRVGFFALILGFLEN